MEIFMPRKEWSNISETIKATQVAFEMEQKVACHIRELAAQDGLTPSDQIRKIIGLTYSPPKRPRLTVSLSEDDYVTLGQKYQLASTDTLGIKRRIMEELVKILDE
jgi:hypothetical protein